MWSGTKLQTLKVLITIMKKKKNLSIYVGSNDNLFSSNHHLLSKFLQRDIWASII